jgi:hypothetical protein
MKGETLMWFRLASHLHMPVQEVQAKTTTSEFFLWQKYFEWELQNKTKLDCYLAEIRTEVRRSYVKDPKRVNTMFVEFKNPRRKRMSVEASKVAWASMLGGK